MQDKQKEAYDQLLMSIHDETMNDNPEIAREARALKAMGPPMVDWFIEEIHHRNERPGATIASLTRVTALFIAGQVPNASPQEALEMKNKIVNLFDAYLAQIMIGESYEDSPHQN